MPIKLCIEVSVPSQESERSCICLRDIDFASFCDFLMDFGIVVFFVLFSFYDHVTLTCLR